MLQYFIRFLKNNYWLPTLWTALMCVLFFAPSSDMPKDPGLPGIDKVVHFALFFGFVFLWQVSRQARGLQIVLLAIGFGIGVEYMQEWMAIGRSFDLYDIVADSVGAVCGAIAVWQIRKYY